MSTFIRGFYAAAKNAGLNSKKGRQCPVFTRKIFWFGTKSENGINLWSVLRVRSFQMARGRQVEEGDGH